MSRRNYREGIRDDDLNTDEPQILDDGWDDENDDGGADWDEEDDSKNTEWDGWDEKEEEDGKEIGSSYNTVRESKGQLQKEMDKIVEGVVDVLALSPGQVEIALREHKWKKDVLETAWFHKDDSPIEMRKKIGLSLCPDEWDEQDEATTAVPCCSYVSFDDKSSGSSKREMKAAQKELYSYVFGYSNKGMSQANILRKMRGKKFKVGDVMKMIQIVTSEKLASSIEGSSTLCSKNGGKFMLKDGHRLNCGHGRCADCWRSMLEVPIHHKNTVLHIAKMVLQAAVNSGKDALTLKCNHITCKKNHQHKFILGCFCQERVPREVFEKYLKGPLLEKYRKMALDTFLEYADNFNLRPCPNP
eukprot:501669-Amorphochlora_amoeboformis.AAC.2